MEHSELVVAQTARKDYVAGVAHNMFLGIAAQSGLVGLILFLAVLFLVFKMALRIAQGSRAWGQAYSSVSSCLCSRA